MSQTQETTSTKALEKISYEVTVSYYVMDIGPDGVPIETKKSNQKVRLLKLQRRNQAHSKLALKVLKRTEGDDELALAKEFVECVITDDRIREDIASDLLACLEIFSCEAVLADFEDFFGKWELLKPVADAPSVKE